MSDRMKGGRGGPNTLPPHPATVVQPKVPHPATLAPGRSLPPHPATVVQPASTAHYSSDYQFRVDAYSDSDEDDEPDYKALRGTLFEHPRQNLKTYEKVEVEAYNATKWHRDARVRALGIDNTVRGKDHIPDLQKDAKAIHSAAKASRPQALTVVCALLITKMNAMKKFCFSNMGTSFYVEARRKAHELEYHVIYANQAHAEAEMIQYMARKGYSLFAMGCDKPHCPECDKIISDVVGGKYDTMTDVGESTFANYYTPPLLVKRWKGTVPKRSDVDRPKDPSFVAGDHSRMRTHSEMQGDASFQSTGAPKRTYYASPSDRKRRKTK